VALVTLLDQQWADLGLEQGQAIFVITATHDACQADSNPGNRDTSRKASASHDHRRPGQEEVRPDLVLVDCSQQPFATGRAQYITAPMATVTAKIRPLTRRWALLRLKNAP
jgi:hypothetical protein